MSQKKHSEAYFGDERDFWWNRDFLELMAKRWRLKSVNSALDVGCGVGHWGQLLSGFLSDNCGMTGIDAEAKWVEEAAKRAEKIQGRCKFNYVHANAQSLPFADNTFDLVTCQTVLIHLREPLAAVKEFIRVLKPGGLVAVAEPNNMIGSLIQSSLSDQSSTDDLMRRVRMQLICERGKRGLGEGDCSLGDLVPGIFAQAGLQKIQVYISDKASPLFPPYSGKEAKTLLMHSKKMESQELYMWDKSDTKRYFIAGGGHEEDFENEWQQTQRRRKKVSEAILNQSFHTAGGNLMYLVSGRK